MEDQESSRGKRPRCDAVRGWIGSPSFYIYLNYILGAWGDWMWQFAVGLYLVKLSGGLLRLAAIYGFCGGGCVLLFGGLIGNWVDRNRRLKVMMTTLFLQNMSLVLSASAVCVVLFYADWIDSTLDGRMRGICEAIIVILAVCAQISSVGYKIAIEKDWIVVIAAGNKPFLANLNAVTRAIDLSCKILAPTTVGFIMSYGSDELAAIFIAVWNFGSVFIEFALLRKVYALVPALAVKGEDVHEEGEDGKKADVSERRVSLNPDGDDEHVNEMCAAQESTQPLRAKNQRKQHKEKKTCLQTMFDPFITLVKGWRTYSRQKVVFAGLSLSFLYMTVLGFDSITTGYIYSNGVEEYLVAISMGMAGVTGILGTIAFTFSRKKIGLERTGLFAFGAEILCLCLCLASVCAPGTLFKPFVDPQQPTVGCARNITVPTNASQMVKRSIRSVGTEQLDTQIVGFSHGLAGRRDITVVGISTASHGDWPSIYHNYDSNLHHAYYDIIENGANSGAIDYSSLHSMHVIRKRQATNSVQYNVISDSNSPRSGRRNRESGDCGVEERGSYISIVLFLAGIVTSRVGLWMADLVVTQLLQENVIETERGTVSGVQHSLNMLMDMLKFTLVIFVPHIEDFGYLIFASFAFICSAACLFAFHSWRVRGHLFRFEKLWNCRRSSAANGPAVVTTKNAIELDDEIVNEKNVV